MGDQIPTVPLGKVVLLWLPLSVLLLRSSSDPPVEPLGGTLGGSCNIVGPLGWPEWLHSSSR